MLKHVSTTSVSRRRGVSPAPSSASISTLESSGSSSSSSTCSSPSASSSSNSCHHSSSSASSTSWRGLADCRTFSRLSMSDNPHAVPMRVYAACLRPDIQYKTIGVTSTTTCEEVIRALLTKCKVRFKDPRLFHLLMEVEIRCPDGYNTRASIKLEDMAIPLQLQECYPRGQARFILENRQGTLIKIFDESNTVGWQYKSILISEKTTAGELVDILFRFTTKNLDDIHFYMLHLEGKDWRRALSWDEMVVPAKETASRQRSPDEVRVVLKSQASILPPSIFMRTSTLSLYDNVTMPLQQHKYPMTIQQTPQDKVSLMNSSPETNTLGRFHSRVRRQRSKSFSESPSPSPVSSSSLSTDSFRAIQNSPFHQHNPTSLTASVLASLNKFSTTRRHGKYELSEAFFV